MRRLLVDHARTKSRKKRGGDQKKVGIEVIEWSILDPEVSEHVLAVDEALHKLTELNELHAKIVEMRFFSGMTVQEVADELGVSKRKIESEWTMIKAWLRKELNEF
jgi:RNA polymerase sigma-70 factor (ECF subfamily)